MARSANPIEAGDTSYKVCAFCVTIDQIALVPNSHLPVKTGRPLVSPETSFERRVRGTSISLGTRDAFITVTTKSHKAPASIGRGFLLFGLQSGYNSVMENDVDLDDELRSEYDAFVLKNGVRGKYFAQYRFGADAEASLLHTINAPLAPEARPKRDALLAEQAQRELTEEEQAALADFIDAVEIANAERWQAVAAIARLRGLSVADIIHDIPSEVRPGRQFGCGRHLLAGVDVDALMAVSIDDMFAEYMPEDKE